MTTNPPRWPRGILDPAHISFYIAGAKLSSMHHVRTMEDRKSEFKSGNPTRFLN